ncbi:hypothetical protein BWQ96_05185 [Gracilariopsis chorda]|uniref:DDE Tnp4 domain-containing protein n=1 Tax=Gracilariopsis chorda TaxID=448386 RepID=A0A2V3ISG3_9FLOR|nr:hypothetical protein BWQ96_05185 [Gracilariopsis chorda]|eukprot:PXF45044.1 hypothetical protein BWQ96_05185 [Gracilariopsis chorda]
MPNLLQVQDFKEAISEKYHKLDSFYAVADGLKLLLKHSGDCVIQNMFYNGWTHDHYVGNVFVFAPNGTIIACVPNAPGSMHDSVIADLGKLYNKFGAQYAEHGGLCELDSAFCKRYHPFLLKSAQNETNVTDPDDFIRLSQANSVRQASELGMRAFQGMFPRMEDRFMYEENGERRIMLLCTAYLFNIRTHKVSISQILSTHLLHINEDVNYYLQDTLNLY